jgi:hypothetical protein
MLSRRLHLGLCWWWKQSNITLTSLDAIHCFSVSNTGLTTQPGVVQVSRARNQKRFIGRGRKTFQRGFVFPNEIEGVVHHPPALKTPALYNPVPPVTQYLLIKQCSNEHALFLRQPTVTPVLVYLCLAIINVTSSFHTYNKFRIHLRFFTLNSDSSVLLVVVRHHVRKSVCRVRLCCIIHVWERSY